MRATTAWLIAAGLALLLAPAAYAQTTETTFTDPAGDAGPAGTELGAAGSDLDIVEVTLASDDEANTSLAMELASFDVRPPDTFYGVAFHVNDTFVFAGYGKVVFPFPPFVQEGYAGCQITGDHENNCTRLDGRELADREGFAVQLPGAWTPAGSTVNHTMAAVFTDTFAPFASEASWQHVWPANAHDLAETDAEHEVPDPRTEETEPGPAASTASTGTLEDPSSLASIGGLSAAGLSVIGLAGAALRRTR